MKSAAVLKAVLPACPCKTFPELSAPPAIRARRSSETQAVVGGGRCIMEDRQRAILCRAATTLISSAIAGLNADDIEVSRFSKDGSATSMLRRRHGRNRHHHEERHARYYEKSVTPANSRCVMVPQLLELSTSWNSQEHLGQCLPGDVRQGINSCQYCSMLGKRRLHKAVSKRGSTPMICHWVSLLVFNDTPKLSATPTCDRRSFSILTGSV